MKKTLLSTTFALGVFVTLGNSQSLEAVVLQPVAPHLQQESLIIARYGGQNHGGGNHLQGKTSHSFHRHGYGWYGGNGVVNEEDNSPVCPAGTHPDQTTFGTVCI